MGMRKTYADLTSGVVIPLAHFRQQNRPSPAYSRQLKQDSSTLRDEVRAHRDIRHPGLPRARVRRGRPSWAWPETKRVRSARDQRQRPPTRRTVTGDRPSRARRGRVCGVMPRQAAASSASAQGGGPSGVGIGVWWVVVVMPRSCIRPGRGSCGRGPTGSGEVRGYRGRMARTDPDRATADALLASRLRAWADFEDRREPVADEVVARELPELLEFAEAFPPSPREPLMFPPFAGGPRARRGATRADPRSRRSIEVLRFPGTPPGT